ncbi:RNA polymerase sigma factor [Marinomonas posidonica]|uniref:RNA polymerase, sigma-24 subunit, ECF subfamily n=1 Tax=Marinomonas posidonica (strain CECT 7376 / NCIMB 14433 / IVIA-Po-181) TaxID=491952 RepID=F6CSJ6_MARPP|nr:sigma-70 family RNA polymerase sigma factor [Marinomonas posidonica]AEF56154.1 RNA polymerase, sigma-24 subunit, ECF subfamily [Marinomonas posidonica IVIA-Po-181]
MELMVYKKGSQKSSNQYSESIWRMIESNDLSIYRICKKYTYTQEDTEDFCSQVKIKLYYTLIANKQKLEEENDLERWLCAIIRNYCIDIYRKNQLYSQRHEYIEIDAFFQAPREESPAEIMSGQQIYKDICVALHCLPPKQFEVAIRRLLWGYSYKEITTELDISHSNARKRLQEARATLRHSLAMHVHTEGSNAFFF